MATPSPPQRQQEEKQSVSLSKKKNQNRKRTKHDPELERLDSLPWNSSLPNEEEDDAFSLFIGSGDLDGGFLSLEEIDESDYGLDVPGAKKKISNKNSKLKKQKLEEVTEGSREDAEAEAEPEPAEGMAEEKNVKAKKKKKKSRKKKAKAVQQEDESATVIDSKDDEKEQMLYEDEAEAYAEFYAWNELRLHPLLMKSISRLGFKEPTPIQRTCIPAAAHQGKDVIGAAETGSGKTLAFGLPIFQRLLEEREKAANMLEEKGEEAGKYAPKGVLRALIITPTRELTLQVTDHLKEFAKDINVRVVPIVGGMSAEKQERLLKTRPEVIVGTPGRLWELMSGGEKHLVELHSLSFFVLDEADRMVEAGHFRELQSIIEMLPMTSGTTEGQSQDTQNCVTVSSLSRKKRQTFVFSATLALSADFRKKLKRGSLKSKQSTDGLNSIEILSERAGMKPNAAIVDLTNASILAKNLEESFIECREEDKDAYLYYILSIHGEGRTIVFCTSIAALRHISSILRILGINVSTLHAQMQQRARLKAIDRFRANEHGILVATDVAARGLDIPGVRTVVHYQLPHSAEVYVHRSGRTARASSDGCSIALISPNDSAKFASLCKSFAKESIKHFPLESSYMPEVMKRLSLACQIDKISRKDSQERANKSWLERSAESLELVVENYDSEEERVKNFKQKKASSNHLKKLQQELNGLLSRPLRPKTFSHRYPTAAGVTHLIQHQFEELAKQNGDDNLVLGENKRRKMVVIGQDCVEPLQALRSAGREVHMDVKERVEKRRNAESLRRKRKEEKKRLRDQRRKQKKQSQGTERSSVSSWSARRILRMKLKRYFIFSVIIFSCIYPLTYVIHLRNKVERLEVENINLRRWCSETDVGNYSNEVLQPEDDSSYKIFGNADSKTVALYTVMFTLMMPFVLYKCLDYLPQIKIISKRTKPNKEEVPLKKRIAYMVDVCFSVYPYAKLLALLFATIFLIGFGGLALYAVTDGSLTEALWLSWTFVADSGNHADSIGIGPRIVSVSISSGGMLIFAMMLGLVSDAISEKVDSLRKGKSEVIEKNHMLILGWSDKLGSLLKQLAIANKSVGGGVVVVLAERDKEEMEMEIAKLEFDFMGTSVICRSGSPLILADLKKVSVSKARAIIVLATDENADQSDARALRVVLSLTGVKEGLRGHVVVEMSDLDNEPLVKLVGGDLIETVVAHDVIGRLMIQCALQPGLAQIWEDILGFENDEFYIKRWPELDGMQFEDVLISFPDAIPCGVKVAADNGKIILNPDDSYVLKEGDGVLVIAEDDDTYSPGPLPEVRRVSFPKVPELPKYPERILFCGWRRDIHDMIMVLEAFLAPGSELWMFNEVAEKERERKLIDGGLDISGLENIKLVHREGNAVIRRHLESLPLETFDSILILADESLEDSVVHSDSRSLATLLLIRDIQSKRLPYRDTKSTSLRLAGFTHSSWIREMQQASDKSIIISEILDSRTRNLVSVSRISDYVLSNELVSMALAMVAEDKQINRVLEELFAEEGNEMCIKPAEFYLFDQEELCFYEIMIRGRQRQEIIIGYRLANSERAIINPPKKSEQRKWSLDDVFVVISSGS